MSDNPDNLPAPDIAQTAARMFALSQRAVEVSSKIQSHMVAKATGAEYSLMDSATLAKAYTAFWTDVARDPAKMVSSQIRLSTSLWQAWAASLPRFQPETETPKKDRRFSDDSWNEDAVAKMFRDAFLALEESVGGLLDDMTENNRDHQRVNFYTRQALSALSPSNYLTTNPAARAKMLETNGESVLDGLENLLDDLERGDGRLDIATNDTQAFEVGVDLATTEGEVV